MPSYRATKYGAVESSVLDPTLKSITDGMKVYLGSAQDFEYMKAPRVLAELLRQFKILTGNDFRSWLSANYAEGTGVRAPLVRSILGYLNGEISGRMVFDTIIRDERKLIAYDRAEMDPVTEGTRHIADEHHLRKWSRLLNDVVNEDFLRFVEGISPEGLARLAITMNGEPSDV